MILHFIIDYPWAGSLKPVSNKMGRRDHPGRRGKSLNMIYYIKTNENLIPIIITYKSSMVKCISTHNLGEESGAMPWAGSLRHVNQKGRRQQKEDSDGK